jgi:hypothetical protein
MTHILILYLCVVAGIGQTETLIKEKIGRGRTIDLEDQNARAGSPLLTHIHAHTGTEKHRNRQTHATHRISFETIHSFKTVLQDQGFNK